MATVQRGHRIVAEPARRQARQGRGRSSTHGTRASAVALARAMLAGSFEAPEEIPGQGHGSGTTAADAARAIELCGRCPVRDECLQWVVGVEATLGPQHVHGIAGGLVVAERQRSGAGRVAS